MDPLLSLRIAVIEKKLDIIIEKLERLEPKNKTLCMGCGDSVAEDEKYCSDCIKLMS